MKLYKWGAREEGAALVMAIILTLTLVVLTTALMQLSTSNFQMSVENQNKNAARNNAEAAVALTIKKWNPSGVATTNLNNGTYDAVYSVDSVSGVKTVIAKGSAGSTGDVWTSTITAKVTDPFDITKWVYTIHSGNTMSFNGNAYTVNGPVNARGTVSGQHAPVSPQLTHNNIQYPNPNFNINSLTAITPTSGTLDLSSIPNYTGFYVNYSGTLNIDGSTGTNVFGIIKADKITCNGNSTIGSKNIDKIYPVILIAQDTVTISGTDTLYGMIYATNASATSGNPKINGMIIASNNVDINGSVVVTNPSVQQALADMGLISADPQIISWDEDYTK